MKKCYLVWLFLSLIPQLAMAQTIKNELVDQSNHLSPNDKLLRAFVPKGGKSRFLGKSKLKYEGEEIWIHIYDVQKTQSVKDELKVESQQESKLDLLIYPRSHHLKQVSSTRFTCKRHGSSEKGSDVEPVEVQLLWLDPRSKKMPVVQIDLQNLSERYGTSSQYVICVFNQGVQKNAVVEQRFSARDFNAPDWNSWTTKFEVMDNSMLGIVHSKTDADGQTETFYKWSNNHSEPFRKMGKGREADKEVELPLGASE